MPRLAVGFMTGTSIDGLDGALVRLTGRGLALHPELVRTRSWPLGSVGEELRRFADGAEMSAMAIADLTRRFGELHARAALELLDGAGAADLVAVHGQTVAHRPPTSWQLLNPWPIALATGAPVVHDLRGADLAAGGQGAPITPIADWLWYRAVGVPRAIVNLGGFCNITLLPAADDPAGIGAIRGMDVCACNHVLDGVARAVLGAPYDADGAAAARGTPDEPATRQLEAILSRQRQAGRSLGSGDEAAAWVDQIRARLKPEDAAATACRTVAGVIASAIGPAEEVIVAGGGAFNPALLRDIGAALGRPVRKSDDLGLPAAYREAAAIAVLGGLCADGVAITLPNVTRTPGPAPIAGSWTNHRALNPTGDR